jgi:hypothetical protein
MEFLIFTPSMVNSTGVYDIQSSEIIEGDLPARANRMVRDWIQNYQSELLEMWKTQQFKQLPGLE